MKPKTILCDIDGVLFEQNNAKLIDDPIILPNVKEECRRWEEIGHTIIIMTGRRESIRKRTEQQLRNAGICYDILLMGVGIGERILINDVNSKGITKAIGAESNSGTASP